MTGRPVGGAPAHLVVGPPRHGVVAFAVALADAVDRVPAVLAEDWSGLDAALADADLSRGVHASFTDRLFGPSPAAAATRMTDLVGRVAASGGRVTVTLHDVPQPADGGNWLDRAAAYRAVCTAVHGVATNSEHERSLLAEHRMAEPADVVVVPLPLPLGDTPVRRPAAVPRTVAVLGFLYPGKGHAEVLAAMAGLPPDVEFVAIGECSAGHADLAGALTASARASGRRFTMTGFVPQRRMTPALHGVTVPVTGHRHVSASGSLNAWIAAGRRPLAPTNRYTVEHAARHPGTVRLYPDTAGGLAEALEAALADPDSTWLAAGAASGSTPADTARRYVRALARWHG